MQKVQIGTVALNELVALIKALFSLNYFESVLNHVVSSEVPPFAPTTETISPARSILQTPSSKSE